MKYFTKEELEKITEKLAENPTREMLKELNNEYNGEEYTTIAEPELSPEVAVENLSPVETTVPPVEEVPEVVQVAETPVVEPIPATVTPESVVTPMPAVEEVPEVVQVAETPVVEPIPTTVTPESVVTPMPAVEEPSAPAVPINVGPEIPSFEAPQQVVQDANNNTNATPINFTGNLWEPQSQQSELMSTTDNFNTPTQPNNTEIPVQPGQFFGNSEQPVNNPIPVSEGMPHIPPAQGPSMFGQFEQNYNG